MIHKKTPEQISKIKILDPACGSGSFLIGAYQYLLDYHFEYYYEQTRRKKYLKQGKIYHTFGDDYYLSIPEKQRILCNNIYGVDIDSQAVEVTRLSLLLMLMNDENRELEQEGQGKLFKDSSFRYLPSLKDNIKCGNSLIGTDFYAGDNLSLFDDREIKRKVNVFDWNDRENGFGDIMAKGGFDCIIGNPPYVDSELMTKEYPEQRQYITDNYVVAKGNWDLYIPFFELGHKLLNRKGGVGLITPNKWLTIPYAEKLRRFLDKRMVMLTNCSKIKVFESGNNPLITFSENHFHSDMVIIESYQTDLSIIQSAKVKRKLLPSNAWEFLLANDIPLINKLKTIPNKVSDLCVVESPFTVSEAYELIKYIKDNKNASQNEYFKFINTGTIDRYVALWGIKATTYIKTKYQFPIVKKRDFEKAFPKRNNQARRAKIIISGMRHFECIYDKKSEYIAGKSTVIISSPNEIDFVTLCAILNSKLITYYLKEMYSSSGIDGGISFTPNIIRGLPVPKPSKEFEQKISKLVDQIEASNRLMVHAKSESKQKHYKDKIDILDNQINGHVYKLYELTPKEIDAIKAGIIR